MRRIKKIKKWFPLFLVFAGLLGMITFKELKGKYSGTEADEAAAVKEEQAVKMEPETEEISKEQESENTAVQAKPEMLSAEAAAISDIYAAAGSIVTFKSFYADAQSYVWEMYDLEKRDWIPVSAFAAPDELGREVSCFTVEAAPENNECMVRCTSYCSDKTMTDTASLYILEQDIKGIGVSDYTGENAAGYINTLQIPVKILFDDDSEKIITGLYGLSFVKKDEQVASETDTYGKNVQIITTTLTECDYVQLEPMKKEVTLRYPGLDDLVFTMEGTDKNPPAITDIQVGAYTVSTAAQTIEIEISVMAEDDTTPYPYLEYGMYPAAEDAGLEGIAWTQEHILTQEMSDNGIWCICVRDRSGNIAVYEKEFIIIDQKPPVVAVSLERQDICRENKIIVSAADKSEVSYHFENLQHGIDSGWGSQNEYLIDENGIWTVTVKDAAGNESTQDIVVECIDITPPVILTIIEGDYENE